MPNFQEVDLLTEPLVLAARSVFGDANVAFVAFADRSPSREPYWFLEHTLEGTRIDLGRLLRSRAFAGARPALATGLHADRMFGFAELEPLALIPSLAGALAAGGPSGARLSVTRAHELAARLVSSLIGDRFDQVTVLHSRACWSDWFACDVWDQTWIIVERDGGGVTLLCMTGGHPPGRF